MSEPLFAIVDFANHVERLALDTADPQALVERLDKARPESIAAPCKFRIVQIDTQGEPVSIDGKVYQLGGQVPTPADAKALPKNNPYKGQIIEALGRARSVLKGDEPRVLCQWRGHPNIEVLSPEDVCLAWPTTPVSEWPREPEARVVFGLGTDGIPGFFSVEDE